MTDTAQLLENLRDIHEPVPPDTASIWWLLLPLLTIVVLAVLLLNLLRHRRRSQQAPWLDQISIARTEPPAKARLRMARLLRHISLNSDDPEVHTLTGNAWLVYLDGKFSTRFFTQGAGREFGDRLYSPASTDEQYMSRVCDELEQLITTNSLVKQASATAPQPKAQFETI